jgi:hypothetical protein
MPPNCYSKYVAYASKNELGTDVMILKIFSPKIFAKKLAFFAKNKAKIGKNRIITLVLEKNANFFDEKLAKIAENCDHNIDPSNLKLNLNLNHFLPFFPT